ncbi:polymorphic toxin-type HINT domain-containing protein [Streptomyces sp. S1A(2023)]
MGAALLRAPRRRHHRAFLRRRTRGPPRRPPRLHPDLRRHDRGRYAGHPAPAHPVRRGPWRGPVHLARIPPGFVGGTRDQDTGLTQLGARPYDPATGRFLSVDPMVDYEQPATINPYAYSNNAPATFSDPEGLFFPILIGIAARIAIQAAIRAAARRAAQIAARKAAEALRKRLLAEARKRAIAAARKKAAAKAKREAARKAAAAKRAAAKRAAQRAAAKRAAARQAAARAKQRAQRAAAKRAQAARAAARKAKPKPRPQPKSQPKPRPKPSQKAKPAQQKKASPKQSVGSKAREEIKSEARGQAEDAATEQIGCRTTNSFVPGTLVVMADGSRKPIENVKLGDKVLATDPKTGETTAQPVVSTILGEGAKNLVKVTVRTGDASPGNLGDAVRASGRDGGGVPVDTGLLQLQPTNDGTGADTATGTVVATDGHPFWIPSLGEWVDASELEPGQRLQSSAGSWLQITAVQTWTQNAAVHNLTIADTHTYYVLAGEASALVHNSNCEGPILTKAQSNQVLDYLGYKETKEKSAGRGAAKIWVNKKAPASERYATQDMTGHGGGLFKAGPSAEFAQDNQEHAPERFVRSGQVRQNEMASPMTLCFLVSKYDEPRRSGLIADWTSFEDVGESFNGEVLTAAEYQRVEDSYISAVASLADAMQADRFELRNLVLNEPPPTWLGIVYDGCSVDRHTALRLLRWMLRHGLISCTLASGDTLRVAVETDFYLSIEIQPDAVDSLGGGETPRVACGFCALRRRRKRCNNSGLPSGRWRILGGGRAERQGVARHNCDP